MIQGLVQHFIFQALGELVSKFAPPFIPGPVLGLVLLLAYLSVRGHVPAAIDLVGGSILQHLGLLFIPAQWALCFTCPCCRPTHGPTAQRWGLNTPLSDSRLRVGVAPPPQ
jgi:holin-like protein